MKATPQGGREVSRKQPRLCWALCSKHGFKACGGHSSHPPRGTPSTPVRCPLPLRAVGGMTGKHGLLRCAAAVRPCQCVWGPEQSKPMLSVTSPGWSSSEQVHKRADLHISLTTPPQPQSPRQCTRAKPINILFCVPASPH